MIEPKYRTYPKWKFDNHFHGLRAVYYSDNLQDFNKVKELDGTKSEWILEINSFFGWRKIAVI